VKNVLLAQFARDGVVDFLRPLRPRAATVFCFHRFADPGLGNDGHDLAALRRNLAFLRRHRLHVVPLADLVATLEAGEEPRPGTVVLTIDDGYVDFATAAAPIFAEFDCPTTVFLVSGFLDGTLWLWWDRIEYMFVETTRTSVAMEIDGRRWQAKWSTHAERRMEAARVSAALESVSDESRQQAIAEMAKQLDVTPPARPPARFAAMSWDDARRLERVGVSYGPHTVTHPILARVNDGDAASQIRDSWAHVRERTTAAVPVFCYPNGSVPTFGARELRLIRDGGLRAAVTTSERHVTKKVFAATPEARFLLPRFAYRDDLPHFAQAVSGVAWVKSIARSFAPRRRAAR
jgi:peptidoglycan/xylan/chitin deacetylase (PgdA/CDA1 family)